MAWSSTVTIRARSPRFGARCSATACWRREDLVEIGAEELIPEGVRAAPAVPTIVFVTVPEHKTVKKRLHIDVSPIDSFQPDEVAGCSLSARCPRTSGRVTSTG